MKKLTFLALVLMLFATPVRAQVTFGKNVVNKNGKPGFYRSEHFDIYYYGLDLNKPADEEHFRDFVGNIEGGYRFLRGKFQHDIERRIPVAVYSTHSKFETGAAITGEFTSEGVGAFVEPIHRRMYTKYDLLPPVRREANVHEMVHEFQFDIINLGLTQRITGQQELPRGFFEGGAEFMAGLYLPLSLDNIRRVHQRMAASNRLTLPTWEQLANDQVNGYTMWMMVFQMFEDKYGAGTALQIQGLKSGGINGLGKLIYELSKGEMGNPASRNEGPEKFDQQMRDYWYGKYGADSNKRPRPYQETESISPRSVTPADNPYPMLLACQFPDGKKIAAFTVKDGRPALITYPVPEEYLYSKDLTPGKSKKANKDKDKILELKTKNLTPQMPPIPWEYLIIQGFETWDFNGSDAGCSNDGKEIAFFARKGDDHALFVVNAENGKILKNIELSLDQAFSPVFSPDGKKIYFSAAKNITRDLYAIELVSGKITNLTSDERFDTAPAVSPDGTGIAYIGSDGDFQHLFLLDLADGGKKQLTFGRFNDSSPSWSEDGAKLVYSSDAKDNIWNLYTLDLKMMVSEQWTEYFGQVLNPMFVKGEPDKVYFTVYWDEDQYRSRIYSNFEIYEGRLKKPISRETFSDKNESTEYSFQPYRSLFDYQLDGNQLANKVKSSENWQMAGGNFYVGASTYYGMFGSSFVSVSNLLQTKQHIFQFASYGSSFQILNYSYLNQENRLARAYSVSYQKFPLYYSYYDITKGAPQQVVLQSTLGTEASVGAASLYPIDKFNRWEVYSRIRHRSYDLFGLDPSFIQTTNDTFPGTFTDTDLQLSRFLSDSSGSNMVFGGAYVRDTVIDSNITQGPYHGNALRAQFEVAPPLGNAFDGYASFNLNARTYRSLTAGVLFAGRVDMLENTRANGDFLLLCGPDMLRGCRYGSMIGNRIMYASAELRFPLVDALVFPRGFGVSPFRGILFADAGSASFSGETMPPQKGTSIGGGIQFLPFNFIWTRTASGKWAPTFYLTMNW